MKEPSHSPTGRLSILPYVKIRFLMGNGTEMEVLHQTGVPAEEFAEQLFDQIKKGPQWLQIDETAVFTGTVSAFTVEEV